MNLFFKTVKNKYWYLAIILLLIMLVSVDAQTSLSSVFIFEPHSSSNPTDNWLIKASFDKRVQVSDILKASLTNATDGTIVELNLAKAEESSPGTIRFIIDCTVAPENCDPPLNLKESEIKKFYFLNLVLKGKPDDTGKVSEDIPLQGQIRILKASDSALKPKQKKSNDKDESDVYISGEMTGSKGNKTQFSTEIKAEYPIRRGKTVWSPVFFNLNASTDPEADPDTMEIGFRYKRNFLSISKQKSLELLVSPRDIRRGFTSFLTIEGKIESERDFDNTNLIGSLRYTFLPKPIPQGKNKDGKSRSFRMWIDPFIGGEFGKNLKSPLKSVQGQGVARLLAGTSVNLKFYVDKSWLKDIIWQNSYVRRWLLKKELSFDTDDNGELILQSFGKAPRDFVESKLFFEFNDYFNPYIAYDWGSVPPSYKKVDHRFRLGFTYKFKIVPQKP